MAEEMDRVSDRGRFHWLRAGVGAVAVLVAVLLGVALARGGGGLPPVSTAPAEPAPAHAIAEETGDGFSFARAPFDPDNPFGLSEAELEAERHGLGGRTDPLRGDAGDEPASLDDEGVPLGAEPPPPFFQDRRPGKPLGLAAPGSAPPEDEPSAWTDSIRDALDDVLGPSPPGR